LAHFLLIGEAPGKNEDEKGVPFAGKSGKILDECLAILGKTREEIFITNIVKCRPPKNRDPKKEEIKACAPYLEKQIQEIVPKYIVTLGRFAFLHFFPEKNFQESVGKPLPYKNFCVFPLYHPASTLYNPKLKPVLINAVHTLKTLL
jgi:DNA polymerase